MYDLDVLILLRDIAEQRGKCFVESEDRACSKARKGFVGERGDGT